MDNQLIDPTDEEVARLGICVEQYVSRVPMTEMHFHRSAEIYYVLHGQRDYFIEDRIYHVEDGDVVIIPPGMFHRTDGGQATRILIQFSEEVFASHFSETVRGALGCLTDAVVVHPTPAEEDRVRTLFTRLLTAYLAFARRDNDGTQAGQVFGLLYLLLFTLSGGASVTRQLPIPDDRLIRAIRYINENYAVIETVDDVAARVFVSKYHLCHLFRDKLGLSVITYLNRVRLRSARQLLEKGGLSVAEVAKRCGFASSTYFCKIFRTEVGLSPKKYASTVGK